MDLSSAAYYLPQNAGDIARKYIKDPQLLSFIDAEVGWSDFFDPIRIFIKQVFNYQLDSYGSSHWSHLIYLFIFLYFLFVVFYSEHSQCFADPNDQCKHGKLLN